VEEVLDRMTDLVAVAEECAVMSQTVEAFLYWAGRRSKVTHRLAGVAWLDGVRARVVRERYEAVKAGLTTWFHLTGGARGGVLEGGGLSEGGRLVGKAGTWKKAGERLKGFPRRRVRK